MTAGTDILERALTQDLESLDDALDDDSFGEELYRALASRRWRKPAAGEGHLALSWGRAEELVNELRGRRGHEARVVAQTGSEGEVSGRVDDALGRLGWSGKPLDTGRHDDAHVDRPASPPPGGQGERDAPVGDSHAWEREAHAEAERSRHRYD